MVKLRVGKPGKYLFLPAKLIVWAFRGELRSRLRIAKEYRLVVESGLFDVAFYQQQYGELLRGNPDPLRHYLTAGYQAGCNPNPLFDSRWYLARNPDVAKADTNPLVHFIQRGWREGRDPHALFNTTYYLKTNPDVAQRGVNPLLQFVTTGFKENRNPNPLFDCTYYFRTNSDVAASGTNPLVHYVLSGAYELRNPHPLFDVHYYVRGAPEIVNRKINPLEHYFDFGIKGRLSPHSLFDVRRYRAQHPDLPIDGGDPVQHYLEIGASLGYDPCELFHSSFYDEQHPEVKRAGKNPLVHYLTEGVYAGFNPNPLFDTAYYLKRNPDVAKSGQNPLVHYIETGALEGRAAGPFFDSQFYLRNNPRIRAARINPLAHYLVGGGVDEGCDPNPFFSTAAYTKEHPELRQLGINPLVHFLRLNDPPPNEAERVAFPEASTVALQIREEEPGGKRQRPGIHLLLDLTNSSDQQEGMPRELSSTEALAGAVETATVLLPSSSQLPQIAWPKSWTVLSGANRFLETNSAIEYAGNSGRHLLVLFGPVSVGAEALERLTKVFDLDPHFGISIPRQLDRQTGELLKIMEEKGDPQLSRLPAQVLDQVQEYYILPDILTACMLIRDVVVSNLRPLDAGYQTIAGAFQAYLCRARRAGFRTVVVNRACVETLFDSGRKLAISWHDVRKLYSEHPDAGRAKAELMENSLHLHESLLGRWLSPKQDVRKSLLLDVRGVPSYFNGTAEAVLSICDAIKEIETDWNIVLWAEPESAKYHSMQSRYSPWPVLTGECNRRFTVALRPSQPWHISTMLELHRSALINLFTILDTISWDILFEAPIGLGAFWDFMCQYADGLIFDSFYTRDRMRRRFPAAESTPSYVSHLSFSPHDYAAEEYLDLANSSDYIFVIGNAYDHKYLAPTVDRLSSSFPLRKIKVLGLKSHSHPMVQAWESGKLPASEIEILFAKAQVIVFPSLYEGFGLPVLKGLSYGRTVIARESALLFEIAGNYRGPGKLLAYSTGFDLVDIVGRVIHGDSLDEIPLGRDLAQGEQPKTWQDVARGLFRFIERQVSDAERFRWEQRERAIRQLSSFSS